MNHEIAREKARKRANRLQPIFVARLGPYFRRTQAFQQARTVALANRAAWPSESSVQAVDECGFPRSGTKSRVCCA